MSQHCQESELFQRVGQNEKEKKETVAHTFFKKSMRHKCISVEIRGRMKVFLASESAVDSCQQACFFPLLGSEAKVSK